MILVADSGSTKTDWRLIDQTGKALSYTTIGFNPYFQSVSNIAEELQRNLRPKMVTLPASGDATGKLNIHFYGAGCSTPEKCGMIDEAVRMVFPEASINVEHDLLAAARAVCGRSPGIVAILGTGSNSGVYNGETIVKNISSWGYLFGDEGSGAFMGKHFLSDYLSDNVPQNITEWFHETYGYTKESIVESVYQSRMPSKYLASFSKFIYLHRNEDYFSRLVRYSFNKFFDRSICRYPEYRDFKLSCVGSVGFYYKDVLREIAGDRGITIDKIIQTPIAELTSFHLSPE